ncbi:helix-turn-helix domain-containing protein [Streptomyces sp. MCAF7]
MDSLLSGEPEMPPPAERARLREAAGVTQARLAQVLQTTTQTVKNWESGRSEPRPPRRQPYLRLLEGWAAQHSAPAPETFTSTLSSKVGKGATDAGRKPKPKNDGGGDTTI